MIRRLALLLCAVVLGLAAVVVYLGNADLGRFKDQLTPLVSDALGRELRIDGDLSLRLGRTVTLRAAAISVANAPWADGPHLLEADELAAEVDLRSLVRGPVRIEAIELQGAVIHLQEAEDGRRNWSQGESQDAGPGGAGALRSLRRIAAFSGSNIRLRYAAPRLSQPAEVVVDTATYGVRDKLISADVSATINGTPLVLAGEIVPADVPATAGALRISAHARMGEVVLKAGAVLADPEVLAISAAEFALDGPDIDYVFDVLNLPKVTSGPLSVTAKLAPDPQRSGFDAAGRVGEYRFAADGWVEDLKGTGGFDVAVRVAGENLSLLGRRFAIGDLPAVRFEVDGRVRSRTGGLEFTETRITVGEEQAHTQGTITWKPDGAEELDIRADYRGMSSRLAATLPGNLSEDGIEFDLGIEGDDAAEPARYLGLGHLAGKPFSLTADGSYRGRAVALRQARVRAGTQEVTVSGRADLVPDAPDLELLFSAERIDLSAWLPGDGRLNPALRTVTGTGRLTVSRGRLTADELALRAGAVSLAGRVALPLADRGRSGEFGLHLQAPSADTIVAGLTGSWLPAQPVDLQGTGSWESGGWQLGDLHWRIPDSGDMRGNVTFAAGSPASIAASLRSERLDLRPASPVGPAPEAAAEGERLIPAWEIPLSRLPDLDAEVEIDIGQLYGAGLGGESFLLDAGLKDRRLIVEKLETQGPRGRIEAALLVEPGPAASYALTLELKGQELYVAAPDEAVASLSDRPRSEVTIALQARGENLRELAASLDGRIRVRTGPGTIPRRGGVLVTLVFEDFLSRTLEMVNPLIKERDEAQMNCFVLVANIEDGVVRGQPLVALQTSQLNLLARGDIDIGKELLNLDMAAQPRRGLGIGLGDLINPFTRVGGTLASPRLVADPKSALFETGAGIATGGIWPVARKLRDRFLGGNPCTRALQADENDANRRD